MKQILKHIMIIIFSILLISACNVSDKKVRGLKEDNQIVSENREIISLISELKKTDGELKSVSDTLYDYTVKAKVSIDDPRLKKLDSQQEALLKRTEEIVERLIRIGRSVIPYAREMLKDEGKESLIREHGIYILGEVSRNRGDEEVILDLLAIFPAEEHHTRLNIRSALLKIGKPAIPYIISQLENKDVKKRFLSFELLQRMTGQKFEYYNFEGTNSKEKQRAVEKIKDWWERNKDSWEMPEDLGVRLEKLRY